MKTISARSFVVLVITFYVAILTALAASIEWLATGAVRIIPIGILYLAVAAAAIWICLKLADGVIAAIDFMTRHE
jgi:hypothetical protein